MRGIKVAELILVLEPEMSSIVEAIKTKIAVERLGIPLLGFVLKRAGERIPFEFIEDLLDLSHLSPSSFANN